MASFERPRQLSTQRTALILLGFCAVLGGFAYLCYLPLMQVYWGVYGRIKPMLSEEDLVAAGKPLPPEAFDLSMSGLEPRGDPKQSRAARAGGTLGTVQSVEGSAWGVLATPLGDSSAAEQGSADALAEESSRDFWQADRGEDFSAASSSAGTPADASGQPGAAGGQQGGQESAAAGGENSGDGSGGASGASSGSSNVDTSGGGSSSLGEGAEGTQAPALDEQGSSEQQQQQGGSPDEQEQQGSSEQQRVSSEQQQQPPGKEQQGKEQQQQQDGGAASRTDLPLDKLQRQDGRGQQQQPASPLAEKHRLTKEMVTAVAESNTVMVTWANFHYKDFVMNWVEHVQATGCKAFLVGAMDDKLLQALVDAGVPAFAMSSGLTTDDFGWGSPAFHKMGREKINLIHTFTQLGFDVLISDVDTVWMRNPIPYVQQYPEADILTSSDHLRSTAKDEGLELWPEAGSAANIGVILFRPSAMELAKEWVEVLEKDSKVWDQNAFNDLFRRGAFKDVQNRADRLFVGFGGRLKIGILPVALFCSGHTFYVQRLPEKLGLQAYVVHGTFQFSGTPGKRHRMRERLLWNDPPEYFDHPAGFVSYDPDLPQELLDAPAKVERDFTLKATLPHFNLVNHQLAQLRAQFGVAEALGRAAILPRLWCGMDRWWAPHDGTIPGSQLQLPYQCPADHVLDLEAISKQHALEFREYSFLDNPRAAALKSQPTLTVKICQSAGEAGCCDGSAPAVAQGGMVSLAPGLTSSQLRTALQEVGAQYKVLRFQGIERAWGGWEDRGQQEAWEGRLRTFASIWCCVNKHPGHVWYDFFWDRVPHTDRHNRQIEGPWRPITGP